MVTDIIYINEKQQAIEKELLTGSPLSQMHRQQLELTDDLLLQGHWGKEDAAGPAHKF